MRHKRCGTLPYVAPELLRDGDISQPTALDMWSLGVLMYELVVGEVPFAGETAEAIRADIAMRTQHGSRPFEPPSIISASLSAAATSLCQGLLAYHPYERLGADGFSTITSAKFFRGLDFDKLLEAAPPFVPDLASAADDQYFAHAAGSNVPSFTDGARPLAFPPSVDASPRDFGSIGVASAGDGTVADYWGARATINVEHLLSLSQQGA